MPSPGCAASLGSCRRAIEELLRFDTPLSLFERWVLEPIEVEGVTPDAARRSRCCSVRPIATRAPSIGPTSSTSSASPNPYLSFGAGIHYCLGAPLAKLELGIAFATLLRRVPRLELVETPRWKPTFVLRGLRELRVRV